MFYSDNTDGADSLADTGFPTQLSANTLTLLEVGSEGNNGVTYTPTIGQPGFFTGAEAPLTYFITSDAGTRVPEPATLALLGFGLGVVSLIHRLNRGLPPLSNPR